MKTYLSRRIPLMVAAGLALAMLALGFLAALGVRSLVAGTASASPDAPTPVGHEWSQVENHGTSGAPIDTYWLGTTADQALELKVNNTRALRLEPNATSPNLIGGHSANSRTSGVIGATISGGGAAGAASRVTDNYGTVGGGGSNRAGDDYGTTGDAGYATVGGGEGNTASNEYATVGGGLGNTASGWVATVGGGLWNTASANTATVGGGDSNNASNTGATVGGGTMNGATGGSATVGGGTNNTASGGSATVGGGQTNSASASDATVGGGYGNKANQWRATVGGGYMNTASGQGATVPGGWANLAAGDYSFAAGARAKVAADHDGSFLFADQSLFNFNSAAANEFAVRSTGGARFVLAIDGDGNPTWTCSVSNGGSWSCSSSVTLKDNLVPADGLDILEQLVHVPLFTWNAKGGDSSVRHIGPMAEDFHAAFGVGEDETQLSTIDLDGVALAAIQGLYELSQEQGARIQALEAHNTTLQQRLDNLEARVSALEARRGGGAPVSQASSSGLPAAWVVLGGALMLALVGLVLVHRRLAGGRR